MRGEAFAEVGERLGKQVDGRGFGIEAVQTADSVDERSLTVDFYLGKTTDGYQRRSELLTYTLSP